MGKGMVKNLAIKMPENLVIWNRWLLNLFYTKNVANLIRSPAVIGNWRSQVDWCWVFHQTMPPHLPRASILCWTEVEMYARKSKQTFPKERYVVLNSIVVTIVLSFLKCITLFLQYFLCAFYFFDIFSDTLPLTTDNYLEITQIIIANTAAEVVRACEYTFCMLSTMEASIAVVSRIYLLI